MHLKQLKKFWILAFILTITIVRSEVNPSSSFNGLIHEQIQQGSSHDQHLQIIAEPISNVEDEQEEVHRKSNIEPVTLNSHEVVIRLCRFSSPLAYLFRTSSWEPSISLRLKTSIYRI